MKSDEDAKLARLFDVRTIERNIRKGLTNRKDYEKYLKSLPDAAEKAAPLESAPLPDDIDDDIDDEDEDDIDDEPTAAGESAAAAPAVTNGVTGTGEPT